MNARHLFLLISPFLITFSNHGMQSDNPVVREILRDSDTKIAKLRKLPKATPYKAVVRKCCNGITYRVRVKKEADSLKVKASIKCDNPDIVAQVEAIIASRNNTRVFELP